MSDETGIATSLLNLVALLLPVVAILLEIVTQVRGRDGAPEMRREFILGQISMVFFVLSGALLAIYLGGVLIAGDIMLQLPISGSWILMLSLISIVLGLIILGASIFVLGGERFTKNLRDKMNSDG